MNQTRGAVRSPSATVLAVPDVLARQSRAFDAIFHDLQLALPWLAAAAPESLAAIRSYLLLHDSPLLQRQLQRRLAQGADAVLQSLLSEAACRLLRGPARP